MRSNTSRSGGSNIARNNRQNFGNKDYSRMNSIDICKELKNIRRIEEGLWNRIEYLLNHPNQRESFDARGLATLLYSISKIRNVRVSRNFINDWEQAALNEMGRFNSQGLANSIYAFAKLEIQPQRWPLTRLTTLSAAVFTAGFAAILVTVLGAAVTQKAMP
jgi:hypothetical protein